MIDDNVKRPVKEQFNFFLIQIASTLITSIFLVLWVAIQYSVNFLSESLQLVGIDQLLLWVFQGIFGVTTLIPILMYYYADTRISWNRLQQRISLESKEEKNALEISR